MDQEVRPLSQQRFEELFYRTKDLSYQLALLVLRDGRAARQVVEKAMLKSARTIRMEDLSDPFQMRSYVALLTRFLALREVQGDVKKLKDARSLLQQTGSMDPLGSIHSLALMQAIYTLSERDRILIMLYALHDFTTERFTEVLDLSKRRVLKRLDRAFTYLKRHAEGEEFPFTKTLRYWQEQSIKELSALAKIDPLVWEEDFEADLLQRMEWAQASTWRSRLQDVLHRLHVLRRRYDWAWLKPVGIGAAIVLCLFLIKGIWPASSQPEYVLESSQSSMVSLSDEASVKKQDAQESAPRIAPVIKTVTLQEEDCAFYQNRILFLTPETRDLYRVANDQVQSIVNCKTLLDAHGGIEWLGEKDGVIYLALMDGKGARWEKGTFKEEEYWDESWFEGQVDPHPFEVIVQNVRYSY